MSASYTPFKCLYPKNKLCHEKTSEPLLELHKASAPQLSGTLPNTSTGTLRNLTNYLHRNPPEPHQVSASQPSKTSQGICTETLRNLTRYLHLNFLEPYRVPARTSPGICTRTLRNFNTVSAPERSGT